jgi:hypothetical protein
VVTAITARYAVVILSTRSIRAPSCQQTARAGGLSRLAA